MIQDLKKKNTSDSQTILSVFGMIAGSIPLTIIAPMPILSVLGMGVGTLIGGISGIALNERMHPDNKKKIVNAWDGMTDIVMNYWNVSNEIILKKFGREIETTNKTINYVGQEMDIAIEPLIKTYNNIAVTIEIKSVEYLNYLDKIDEKRIKRKEENAKYMDPIAALRAEHEQWRHDNWIAWRKRDEPSVHQGYWKI